MSYKDYQQMAKVVSTLAGKELMDDLTNRCLVYLCLIFYLLVLNFNTLLQVPFVVLNVCLIALGCSRTCNKLVQT